MNDVKILLNIHPMSTHNSFSCVIFAQKCKFYFVVSLNEIPVCVVRKNETKKQLNFNRNVY